MRLLMLLAALLSTQAEVGLEPYLDPGRSWSYAVADAKTTYDPETGLLLHDVSLPDGSTIEYERPVVLLPATLTEGEAHTSQRRFVRRRGGEKIHVGAHYFEAELVGTTSVETAAGSFEGCLEIRRRSVRMDYSGGQEGFDATEWWAPERGLVKATGTRFVKDAEGVTTSTEPIELE